MNGQYNRILAHSRGDGMKGFNQESVHGHDSNHFGDNSQQISLLLVTYDINNIITCYTEEIYDLLPH